MTKCSLTGEKCVCYYGGFYGDGDSCPYYKNSSRRYKHGESKDGAQGILADTCRFYGIARAKRLEGSDFYDK